jgi:hypothetical protein
VFVANGGRIVAGPHDIPIGQVVVVEDPFGNVLVLLGYANDDVDPVSFRPTGPLHGVPVGVKDIFDTADMPTENGSVLYAGRTPSRDAAVIAMLRAAGAVIMGKTVTTEFAYFSPGKTRNPHNPEHTPGGSSSGSAAAVAADMVPLAVGSQTNGSTIRPAAYCGVIGFKPTHGLIPRQGILALSRTLDHVGLFARSIDDIALLAAQLVGYDEHDPDTRPRARIPFVEVAAEEPPLPPMFAFVKTPHWERADEDTKKGFAELIEQLGEQVEEIELLPSAIDAWELHRTIMEAEMAANLEREWDKGRDRLSEQLRAQLERGRNVRAIDYQRARSRIAPIHEGFVGAFRAALRRDSNSSRSGSAPEGLRFHRGSWFCTLGRSAACPRSALPLLRARTVCRSAFNSLARATATPVFCARRVRLAARVATVRNQRSGTKFRRSIPVGLFAGI